MKLFSNGLCKSDDSLTDTIKALSLSLTVAELIGSVHTNVDIKQLFGPTATRLQHFCEALVPEEMIKTNMYMCVRIDQRGYSPTKHSVCMRLLLFAPYILRAGEIVSLAAICVRYGGLQSEVMHYVRHVVTSASGQ